METETTTSESLNGGKVIVEEILASEKRNKKSRTVRDTVSDQNTKVNHLSKVI